MGVIPWYQIEPLNPSVVPPKGGVLANVTIAGLSTEEALAAGTNVSAAYLSVPSLGRVMTGAPAGLLVLNADPVSDLHALSDIHSVVASGRLYTVEFLHGQMDRYRRHHENFTWDTILPMVSRLMR